MTKPTQNKRLSRFVPDKGAFSELTLKDRDYEILSLIHAHRFLSLELIWRLLGAGDDAADAEFAIGADGKKRPTRYAFGEQALSKRLKQLFHARYLERHYITDQPMGRGHGVPRAIYGLGPKCPIVLERRTGIPAGTFRRIVESNSVRSPFLRHALELAHFHVALELACRQSADRVRLLFWEQGDVLRDFVVVANEHGEEERIPVRPDAFFGIEVEGKGRAHFFLEIDRGTEPILSSKDRTSIRQKLLGYRTYRSSPKFQSRYAYRTLPNGEVVGIDQCVDMPSEGRHMVTGFQVLFVVPGRIEPTGSAAGRIANILSEMPSLGKFFATTSLFWFTSPVCFSLHTPSSLFDSIWLTPKPTLPLQSLII